MMLSLTCTTYQACDKNVSSIAVVYCIQCNSLQCLLCDEQIHRRKPYSVHERLNIDVIHGEYCSINRTHPAVFYCSTCSLLFCYSCYVNEHRDMGRREHELLKFKQEQNITSNIFIASSRKEEKAIYQDLSSYVAHDGNVQNQNNSSNTFTDVQLISEQHANLDHVSNTDSDSVFLLLDANEHLTVNSEFEFLRQLKCLQQDPKVKCISIIGNTGDGKSFTLNEVFFNGKQKFHTSSSTDSCTFGVWSALDENQRTLILDTEGRLGLSQNDNIRNRLLLKILCISDVVIYRTRAPRLPNDMFQFLSNASSAFQKYFRKELENVMQNCKVDGPTSIVGPTLIIFHETHFTEILKDDLKCRKTAVEQLKERFEKMKLSYDAYSSIEYVGTQTSGGEPTDFKGIRAAITGTLENNNIRSPRYLSVIFKALRALNEKFNHAIPPDMPSTLPDEFFACYLKCLSCGMKCTLAANHQKEKVPHECDKPCSYNRELDNEVWKCLQCCREAKNTTVYGKLINKGDGLLQGLFKYVWSGFVIECPHHGEIYRSRKHWYGNTEPKDVTRVEIIHVWPGQDSNRLASDVTPRKIVEAMRNIGSYLSTPTKMLKEMVADQVAPSYWIPNKDVHECSSCKLVFGLVYSKHHCRACGHAFCDTCTTQRAIVPLLDPNTLERVCQTCFDKIQSETFTSTIRNSSESTDNSTDRMMYHVPVPRRAVETIQNNIVNLGYEHLVKFIQESTRPSYWRPDSECHNCAVCDRPFNKTTHRLHHCRKCGEGVCDACSPNKRPVPEREWYTDERVCISCEKEIDKSIVKKELCEI